MKKSSSASRAAATTAWGLARTLALIWLVPALLFNVDWTGHLGWAHNAAAVGMIVGAALLIHVSLAKLHIVGTPVLMAVALFLVYGNTKQAVRTLSFTSEVASEARETKMAAASQLASQRSRLESRRAAQAQIAGEAAYTTIEAELESIKVAEPQRWRLTKGCDPLEVTKSIEFCTLVAKTKAKLAAAAARDRIDGELRELPSATTGVAEAVPRVADAYVANVISLLEEIGLKPTERLVAAEEAMSRALGLELLAAFGPACWLIFLDLMAGASTVARTITTKRTKADEPTITKPAGEQVKADAVDRWIADDLEIHEGEFVFAKQLRSTAGFPAHQPGINENMIWSRLKKMPGVKHDPNNGRPRYFGIRLRKGPILATIGGARV